MGCEQDLAEHRSLLARDDEGGKASCTCIKARHALAVNAFVGFFIVYCLRVNLSVALVAMVNSTSSSNDNRSKDCPDVSSGTNSTGAHNTPGGEFDWDEETQSIILGAFFYGYVVTQVPGGYLAGRIGGKKLFGLGILCTSLLTLVTPFAARAGVPYLVTVRILEGVGEAVTFPAMHAMWGVWAPIYERSRLVSIPLSGSQLGTVFAMPVSGLLCQYGFAGGWPSVFYVFGALGCVWFVSWMLLVHDTPALHPRITLSERKFIEQSIGKKQDVTTPWRHIFTSPALWGLAAAHFASNWGSYSMLTCLPTYMKNILHFDIKQNGFLSAVPYLVTWFVQMGIGFLADFLRYNGHLTTQNTRKLMNTLGSLLPAGLMVGAGYAGCDHTMTVVLLTMAVGLSGLSTAGYNVNHLDIAPKFAGTLGGITNTLATVPGFLGPAVVGILTNHKQTTGQWLIFFYITAGIYTTGALLFCIFAKGEEQWWAKSPPSLTSALNHEHVISVSDAATVIQSPDVLQEEDVLHRLKQKGKSKSTARV